MGGQGHTAVRPQNQAQFVVSSSGEVRERPDSLSLSWCARFASANGLLGQCSSQEMWVLLFGWAATACGTSAPQTAHHASRVRGVPLNGDEPSILVLGKSCCSSQAAMASRYRATPNAPLASTIHRQHDVEMHACIAWAISSWPAGPLCNARKERCPRLAASHVRSSSLLRVWRTLS